MQTEVATQFTLNPASDEPIMMLDKHIGYDEKEGMGIDGSLFAAELYALAETKKRVKVYINSVGGSVIQGMQIFNAVLDAPCMVDTYNIGVAASMAACIFQAGRKRYAYDYCMTMIHNVQNSTGNAEKAFNASVTTMLMRKTNKEADVVENMMKRTSWLSASECMEAGLCDEIIKSGDKNRPKLTATDEARAMWLAARNSFSDEFNNQNKNKMDLTKVTARLNLVEGSTPEAIVKAIELIENRATTAEGNLAKETEKVTALKTELATAQKEATEAKNSLTEIQNKENDAKAAEVAAEAKTAVEAAMVLGKITGGDDVKNAWIEEYKEKPAATKLKLESLAVNKTGSNLQTEVNNSTTLKKAGSYAQAEMIAIEAKLRVEDVKK